MNNLIIKIRNSFLQTKFKIDMKKILNPGQIIIGDNNIQKLNKEISSSLSLLKTETMTEDGKFVNYDLIKKSLNFKHFQNIIIPQLKNINLKELQTEDNKKAFWINIYNALVLHEIIQFNITNSVTDNGITGMMKFFNEGAYNIGSHRFSLEDIEHGILRINRGNPYLPGKQFSPEDPRINFILSYEDPRIHFGLNCASISCPPINFYSPALVDQQLDLASKNFVNQEVIIKNNHLELSAIFKWYMKDFGGKQGLLKFLNKYLHNDKRKLFLENNKLITKFNFTPYNWKLNQYLE